MKELLLTVAVLCAALTPSVLPYKAQAATTDYFDTVQKVYIGYYQRPADPGGLLYWADRLDRTSGNLNEIIEAYANSAESQALYGTINNSNIGTVVDGIYMALFNRPAEAGGKAFYINGFNTGQFTAATIMLNVLYGAQNQDLLSLNNKVTAANLFTETIDPDSNGKDFQATYAGDNDAIAARNFLTLYATSARTTTQAEAAAYIQAYIADPGETLSSRPLTTSVIAPATPGNTSSYTVTGTLTYGTTTIKLTGASTYQILSTTKRSPVTLEDCLDGYGSVTLSGGGETITDSGHDYFLQDADGSVRSYGEQNGSTDVWVISPTTGFYLSRMSPVAVGQSHGSSVTFDDGSSITYTYTVNAIEEVSTGMGTYQAYRVSTSTTKNYATGNLDRMVQTGTSWMVPGLGRSVKWISNTTEYSGGGTIRMVSLTSVLFSTNVSY